MGKDKQTLVETRPILNSELSFKTIDALSALKSVPTQETSNHLYSFEYPYENTNITKVEINPKDPPFPLKFSATYVLESSQETINQIDKIITKNTGNSLSELSDILVINDKEGEEVYRIAPIIFEKYYDENNNPYLIVADGNNRLFRNLRYFPEKNFQAIIVEGVKAKYQPTFDPVDLSEVVLLSEAPSINQRRHLHSNVNPATYQDHLPDFSFFGDSGPRSSSAEKILNLSLKALVPEELPINQDLIDKIRFGFSDYAPPPVESITAPKLEDGLPEVVDFNGVSKICSTLGSADFVIKFSPEVSGNFKAIIKTKAEFENTATIGTAIINPGQAKNFSPYNTAATGEFNISPELISQINEHSHDLDLGLPKINVATSKNHSAPEVINHRIWDKNKKYYSIIILELSNGKEIPIILNHSKKDEQGQDCFGTSVAIRNAYSNIVLSQHHREMIGLSQVETPRMFGFDKTRLEHELGEDTVSFLKLDKKIKLNSCHSIDNSPIDFRLYDIEYPDHKIMDSFEGIYEQSKEVSRPGRLFPREAHNYIKDGKLGDTLTIATITLNQLQHRELYLNPKFRGQSVLFERVFDPLNGPTLIMPRLSLSFADRFSSQHTDLGKSLDVTFSRLLDFKTISSLEGHNYVPIPVEKLAEMALSGKIDYLSLSHLSVLLRRNDVWCYQRQVDPRSISIAMSPLSVKNKSSPYNSR